MKIEPFIFKVSNNIDQYNIVQKVLIDNGYGWVSSGMRIIPFTYDHDCISFYNGTLAFSYISTFKLDSSCNRYYHNDIYFDILTFEEFYNRYSLKVERRKKLERLRYET